MSLPSRESPPRQNLALNLSIGAAWVSPSSREKYPLSSYTACAFDVLLGLQDLCLGDFWVTSQRISMGVQFMSPPFASDHLYLIAPRGQPQEDFASMLAKPFLPFLSHMRGRENRILGHAMAPTPHQPWFQRLSSFIILCKWA